MRKILILLLAVLTIAGCKKKQESDDIIIRKPQLTQPKKGPTAMAGDNRQTMVKWLGTEYTVSVERHPDSTLAVCDNGQTKTYDNRVRLRVLRKDGSAFIDRTYTQKDFTDRVSGNYPKGSALLSVYLDKAEGDNLCFIATIGLPDALSDEYVPLQVKISRMGAMSVSKMQEE